MEHSVQHFGGIIGLKFNKISNKTLSFILSFASGLMMSIVCFELIPEALGISEFSTVITGIAIGIAVMVISDTIVQNKLKIKNNSLLKTGLACRHRLSPTQHPRRPSNPDQASKPKQN